MEMERAKAKHAVKEVLDVRVNALELMKASDGKEIGPSAVVGQDIPSFTDVVKGGWAQNTGYGRSRAFSHLSAIGAAPIDNRNLSLPQHARDALRELAGGDGDEGKVVTF